MLAHIQILVARLKLQVLLVALVVIASVDPSSQHLARQELSTQMQDQ